MELIYWSVRLFSRRGGSGAKGVDGGIFILALCEFHFIRKHAILVTKDFLEFERSHDQHFLC